MHRKPLRAAALALLLAAAPPAAGGEGTREADLNLLVDSILATHPDPHRRLDPSAWRSEAARLGATLTDLDDARLALEFQRLLALAADGHTELAALPRSLAGEWLPIIPRRFADGWFVRTGHRRYRELFGARILRLGDLPTPSRPACDLTSPPTTRWAPSTRSATSCATSWP